METPSAPDARYPLADDASGATNTAAPQVRGGKYQALRDAHVAALARRRHMRVKFGYTPGAVTSSDFADPTEEAS